MNAALIAGSRGLYYIAVMLLFGTSAFAALLRAHLPVIAPPRLRALRWTALAAAIVTGCAWAALAARQMADALDSQVLVQTATDTLFGQLFLVRMGVLALLAVTLALSRGHRAAALLAAIALILPAATSHAASSSPAGFTAIGIVLDAVHLLTAGFWIGGLAVLALLFARKEANIVLALSLFSDWAMVAVLLLAMTGLIDGVQIVLGDKGAASPLYLAVLGTKLLLVTAMLALAAVNRFRLMPKGGDGIARNVALELGLGAIVVLLAGALGQLQPTL
ncbi:MAG TPA: CopD family protein [Rhizomicrobium sp.]